MAVGEVTSYLIGGPWDGRPREAPSPVLQDRAPAFAGSLSKVEDGDYTYAVYVWNRSVWRWQFDGLVENVKCRQDILDYMNRRYGC